MNTENKKKKILVVMPRFPYPITGACEQDRAEGLNIFLELGYEIRVIAKVSKYEEGNIDDVSKKLSIKIFPVSYKFSKNLSFFKRFLKNIKRIINPLFWDGASYEYRDNEILNIFKRELDEFRPDVVWVEYTTLWPLYKYAKRKNIPIVTRSINFEALHFLEEDGISVVNLFKFISKFFGEIITIRKSDFLLAITPKEENLYRKFGAKHTAVLPLRSLSQFLFKERQIKDREKLNVFFMGSTYNVSHNRRALEEIVKNIIPLANKIYPNKFYFHITGGKLPKSFVNIFSENTTYHGFVQNQNMDTFLEDMDIALIPSLFGAGMQQKVFEPLARGIPTITSSRGLAGYPFKDGKHLLFAKNTNDFVEMLGKMRDYNKRKEVSLNAKELCREIFSEKSIKSIISKALNYATHML